MNTATSLGPLAYAVIEQYGDLARTAVASSIGRRKAASLKAGDGYLTATVAGHLFSEHELSLQYLQAGNWIAVGCVTDGAAQLVVEINLRTQEVRERQEPCRFEPARPGEAPDFGATAHTIPPAGDELPWSAG